MLHYPLASITDKLQVVGNYPATNRIRAALCLPLRNQTALSNLLSRISDPSSPDYRHYLTPDEFTEQFGPTKEDYAAAVAFVQAQGLNVAVVHPDRRLLDIEGMTPDFERVFHLHMRLYRHPKENRIFHAPDTAPAIDLAVPVLSVCDLDDYSIPHPAGFQRVPNALAKPMIGSGPEGDLWGSDFRKAYAPGVALTGSGQSVGLLQFDGYYANDITNYASQAGLPGVPTLQNVLIDGASGIPSANTDNVCEVSLDIEMAISMAPGLSKVIVYEGKSAIHILARMAQDNAAKQLSCSWTWQTLQPGTESYFLQFQTQGQSFFQASGDSDAYTGAIDAPADDPNITVVGGTTLTTDSSHAWQSETAWNWGGGYGSGGGISTTYAIPGWQIGANPANSQVSTQLRNIPDIAMNADNLYLIFNNGQHTPSGYIDGGTSAATPLWAGFCALINQQSAANGHSPVGFFNPPIYALGTNTSIATTIFHDIVTGDNIGFNAVPGYDLCTGWGSPAGQPLINALAPLQLTLTVVSTQGGIAPGTVTTNTGALVSERVSNSPVVNSTTQYVCASGTVVGNSFTQLNPTNITLTLTNNAVLTWNWQTQYLLTSVSNGPGTVTAGGWMISGSNATLTATPNANAHLVQWSGNTNGCAIAGNVLTAAMTQARSVTALFATNTETLSVVSAQGGTRPGASTVNYATPLSEWVTNSPVVNGTTQYVCTGGVVAGNSFNLISPTNITLTLTNNATLAWTWTTNYWLHAGSGGNGSAAPTDVWVGNGSNAQVTAIPAAYYTVGSWSGQTNNSIASSNQIAFAMTAPRTLQVQFNPLLATNNVPQWWLAQYGLTNGGYNAAALALGSDGLPNWQNYIAGANPTNAATLLHITSLTPGSRITFTPAFTNRIYVVLGATNLQSVSWTPLTAYQPGTGVVTALPVTNSAPRMFYRIGVQLP